SQNIRRKEVSMRHHHCEHHAQAQAQAQGHGKARKWAAMAAMAGFLDGTPEWRMSGWGDAAGGGRWGGFAAGPAGRGGGGHGGPRGRRRMFDRGELRLVLLKLLGEQPRHGYDLIKALEEA